MNWSDLVERLESDLLSRHGSGTGVRDEAAWEQAEHLLRAQGGILLATHPALHRDEMDDVIQETLLKLQSLATMRRLRLAGSPAGYVTVMLRNAVVDRLRKRFKEQGRIEEFLDDLALQPHVFGEETEEDEKAVRLRKALRNLNSADRHLLQMRFWRNMEIGQIANGMGISYSAAAVRLFRILHRLRDEVR
jgi:RNA polymerase sigma factor (sigma-70 family)